MKHLRSFPRNYSSCISYRQTEWTSHPGHQGLLKGRGRAARTRSHCIISKGQVGLWRQWRRTDIGSVFHPDQNSVTTKHLSSTTNFCSYSLGVFCGTGESVKQQQIVSRVCQCGCCSTASGDEREVAEDREFTGVQWSQQSSGLPIHLLRTELQLTTSGYGVERGAHETADATCEVTTLQLPAVF